MSVILQFFVKNYIWFLVISFILIFALIGYFVDTKKDERFEKKIEIDKELESKLAAAGAANLTINQMMKTPEANENAGEAIAEELLDEGPKDLQDKNDSSK